MKKELLNKEELRNYKSMSPSQKKIYLKELKKDKKLKSKTMNEILKLFG